MLPLARYMSESLIRLSMTTEVAPWNELQSRERWVREAKEQVLAELIELFASQARVGNPSKLLIDFVNRERKATTALGMEVAVPHVRTIQAKEFRLAFARADEPGYEFDAPDARPVRLFFVMAAPPYDDTLYLKAFQSLAQLLQDEAFRDELFAAQSAGEIIRAVRARQ